MCSNVQYVHTCFHVHSRVHLVLSVFCRRCVINVWKSRGIWWGLESGHPGKQGCAWGLFSRDFGETESQAQTKALTIQAEVRPRPRLSGRGIPSPRWDRAEALLRLATASRPRRQDRGHIPAGKGILLLCVHHAVCACVCRISVGGNGDALYPVLSGYYWLVHADYSTVQYCV